MSLTKKLADKHETDIHEWLGGHRSKSSGNQFNDPADGRMNRYEDRFAFAWDCKAAMPGTKSISITREMIAKIEHQARGERIALPLRFYSTDRGGVEYDLVAITVDDLRELLEAAGGAS